MMYCAKDSCDGKTTVVETRGSIRRRRCLTCRQTFLTEEVEYKLPKNQKSPFALKTIEKNDRLYKSGWDQFYIGKACPDTGVSLVGWKAAQLHYEKFLQKWKEM